MDSDIPYLLLTPGPLTTSRTVKEAMLNDYCTWDDDYNQVVSDIRSRLVRLVDGTDRHTCVLMQGSGTFGVEATLGSVVEHDGKVLVVDNGAYGRRLAQIVARLGIDHVCIRQSEILPVDPQAIADELEKDLAITHIAMVHCETTTGLLNPVEEIGRVARQYGKTYILDAMSSLGGMPMGIEELGVHYLISSSNKCVQGVPGFSFVLAERDRLAATQGRARSLSLDLYDQWREMEGHGGKWRYTSPTHVVRAFQQALNELDAEGGVEARSRRYTENHRVLVDGMAEIGFRTLVAPEHQSHIITSFLYPNTPRFTFEAFYEAMKKRRFVLYPGKVSEADTFRIGTIGHVFPDDFRELVTSVREVMDEL